MRRTRYRVFREHPGTWLVKNVHTEAIVGLAYPDQDGAFRFAERLAKVTPGFTLAS